MRISRLSPLTGTLTTLDLAVTVEQMTEFHSPGRRLIQLIFPGLTVAEREFIKTGYSPDDQAKLFTPPQDDQ